MGRGGHWNCNQPQNSESSAVETLKMVFPRGEVSPRFSVHLKHGFIDWQRLACSSPQLHKPLVLIPPLGSSDSNHLKNVQTVSEWLVFGVPCSRTHWASQVVLVVKNLPANTRDLGNAGLILGSERPPGGEHSNPLMYSCLENPKDRGAWLALVHWVAHDWSNLVHTCRRQEM